MTRKSWWLLLAMLSLGCCIAEDESGHVPVDLTVYCQGYSTCDMLFYAAVKNNSDMQIDDVNLHYTSENGDTGRIYIPGPIDPGQTVTVSWTAIPVKRITCENTVTVDFDLSVGVPEDVHPIPDHTTIVVNPPEEWSHHGEHDGD